MSASLIVFLFLSWLGTAVIIIAFDSTMNNIERITAAIDSLTETAIKWSKRDD